MIQLVFAHNGIAFGADGGMPWPHISQDFKNFKARTKDTVLIMGAKTFESLPGILPGRRHIVACNFSRSLPLTKAGDSADSYISIDQLGNVLSMYKEDGPDVSVIGGVGVLEEAIDYADQIVETQISAANTKEVTAVLTVPFISKVQNFGEVVESHFYKINDVTSIKEIVRKLHTS